jgi:methylaspartate ammonia-lyase
VLEHARATTPAMKEVGIAPGAANGSVRISRVLATAGLGGYYFDDLAAIRAGAQQDGFFYLGLPLTDGYDRVRQPGESVSVILVLDNGQVAFGDAVSIQYSGVVGRDPVFIAERYLEDVRRALAPLLEGRELDSLTDICREIEDVVIDGSRLHTALRYGASQAVLDAISKARGCTMAEVVAAEYGTVISREPIPVLAQSGDDRHVGADKMILKRVPVIPQGLFNSIEKVGPDGEKLREYIEWLRARVQQYGDDGYRPIIHLDVYGMVGDICDDDVDRMVAYLQSLEEAARPFHLRIETPVDAGTRDEVLRLLVSLRTALRREGCGVSIVADDWCNTLEDVKLFARARAADMVQIKTPDLGSITNSIEAVLACKAEQIGAFLGGTCNGTDQSSRVTVHVALATQADLIYNKPGMGVDEGLMIVANEMARTLCLLEDARTT